MVHWGSPIPLIPLIILSIPINPTQYLTNPSTLLLLLPLPRQSSSLFRSRIIEVAQAPLCGCEQSTRYKQLSMLGFDYQKITQQERFRRDFEDLGPLGSGGFAEVRRVRSKLDGRLFAAKIITLRPGKDEDQAQEQLYRALSEARLHAQLHHPQILRYHGCWIELEAFSEEEQTERTPQEEAEDEFQMVLCDDSVGSDGIVFGSASAGSSPLPAEKSWQSRPSLPVNPKKLSFYKHVRIFITTELCEMNLQSFLHARNSALPSNADPSLLWGQNYELALDITRGLGYLHSQRIIHRDVKLHNVVLAERGRCRLIDFGLARKARYWKSSMQEGSRVGQGEGGQEEQEFSKSVGTKLFSSPEQASSEKYDYRTDIFSLAMVVVLLFCTFTTAHQQRDLIQLIRARKLDSISMPPALKGVLYRCLGAEHERPQLHELVLVLKQLMREHAKSILSLPLAERNGNKPSPVSLQLKALDAKIH